MMEANISMEMDEIDFERFLSTSFNITSNVTAQFVNITSNVTEPFPHRHYVTPMSVIVALISSLLCVSGFFGNIIIAAIIIVRKKMQTTTNWFILNLTICDLLIICTSIPMTLVHHFSAYVNFPFGEFGCKYAIMPVLEHFASVSVLTHTAISFARYTVISGSSFRGYIKPRFVGFIIFLIWSLSFIMLSATLMGILGYFEFYTDDHGRSYCNLHWVTRERQYIYRTTVFLLTYVIPMMMTGKSYYTIHTVVRDSLNRVNSLLTESMLRSRSRTLNQMNRTLTVMYTTFAMCTLPFQVFFCLFDFGVLAKVETNFIIFDVFLVLFYAQILSNPFVLLYVGDEYRKELRRARRTFIPKVNKWSKKMEGSINQMYRRQENELTSNFDLDESCTEAPSPAKDVHVANNTLCVPTDQHRKPRTISLKNLQSKVGKENSSNVHLPTNGIAKNKNLQNEGKDATQSEPTFLHENCDSNTKQYESAF